MKITFLISLILPLMVVESKTYGKCEFANALRNVCHFPESDIPTWLCIAEHESHYNTDAYNAQTKDHGIFQISELYWCTASGPPGGGCNKNCADFHNDDISDDCACVRTIFAEHQRLSGNGFNAWTTYKAYCGGDNAPWLDGC